MSTTFAEARRMPKVNLIKQVVLGNHRRWCRAALSANGRVKSNIVLVDGREEHHPGSYYLEWREVKIRRRQSVGKNSIEAGAARLRKEAELNARAHGIEIPSESKAPGRLLANAVDEYLDEIKTTKSPATHSAYSLALRGFLETCAKPTLEQVARTDLIQYLKHLREHALADRTCHNRFQHVLTFLEAFGVGKL